MSIEPKLDILIIGVPHKDDIRKVDMNVINYLRQKRQSFEIMETPKAIQSYNFLVFEGRHVGGAIFPVYYLEDVRDEDLFATREARGSLFFNPMSHPKYKMPR